MEEFAPPTVKLHVSKPMLAWLDVALQCEAAGLKPDDVKRALYQIALLPDPEKP